MIILGCERGWLITILDSNYTGCMDKNACNYNLDAVKESGECEYDSTGCIKPSECKFDCTGNCIVESDCFGICGGNSVVDCLGDCGGGKNIDCDGVCGGTSVVDCAGICGGTSVVDCTGNCTQDPVCVLDCAGNCSPADWLGDEFCDNGFWIRTNNTCSASEVAVDFDCEELSFDTNDCQTGCALPAPSTGTGSITISSSTITWEYAGSGQVHIWLFNSNYYVYTIQKFAVNDGERSFSLSSELPASDCYQVVIGYNWQGYNPVLIPDEIFDYIVSSYFSIE